MLRAVLRLGIVLGLAACGSDDDATTVQMSITVPARCTPGETKMCPCLGGGKGTQTCDSTGAGYGVCSACNSPSGSVGMGGRGGTGGPSSAAPVAGSGAVAGRGGAGAGAGTGGRPASGPSAGSGGTTGAAGSSSAGRSSVVDEGDRPMQLSAEKGVTCGVGLPVQCAETEKCCKRSLATDSCEPAASMCMCEEQGCVTVDVRCDGPEDCPQGQQCCATDSSGSSGGGTRPRPGGSRFTGFSCAAMCSSGQRQACHADADCSNQFVCAISQQLASISTCTDPRTLEQ